MWRSRAIYPRLRLFRTIKPRGYFPSVDYVDSYHLFFRTRSRCIVSSHVSCVSRYCVNANAIVRPIYTLPRTRRRCKFENRRKEEIYPLEIILSFVLLIYDAIRKNDKQRCFFSRKKDVPPSKKTYTNIYKRSLA